MYFFSFSKTWLHCTTTHVHVLRWLDVFCSYNFLISQQIINLAPLLSPPTGTVCFHLGGQSSVFEGDSHPDRNQINKLLVYMVSLSVIQQISLWAIQIKIGGYFVVMMTKILIASRSCKQVFQTEESFLLWGSMFLGSQNFVGS